MLSQSGHGGSLNKYKLVEHLIGSTNKIRPSPNKGPNINYVGGGGEQRVFVRIMKYFRRILMGHEIFFKMFYGPQTVFPCSIFLISFFS